MNKVKVEEITEITTKGIYGFIQRKVTKFVSMANVSCLTEFLERRIYLIITRGKEQCHKPDIVCKWKILIGSREDITPKTVDFSLDFVKE
jgi:putative transposon-encoded protein